MGHDEEGNKTFSAADELNRIVEAEQKENLEAAGGDIVLAPVETPKKDKKVIIAIVLAIVTVIVFAVGFMMKGGGISGVFSGTSAGTGDFTKWLLNGDGSVATTTEKTETELKIADFSNDEEKLIYPLNFYNVTTYATRKDENIEKYFSELNNKYETLKNEKANSNQASDVEKLGKLINLLENSVNYAKIQRDIVKEYSNNKTAAENYFKEHFKKDLGDDNLNAILNVQAKFYEDSAVELVLYSKNNCYNQNTGGDFECIIRVGNADLMSAINEANNATSQDFRKMASEGVIKKLNKEIVGVVMSIGGK